MQHFKIHQDTLCGTHLVVDLLRHSVSILSWQSEGAYLESWIALDTKVTMYLNYALFGMCAIFVLSQCEVLLKDFESCWCRSRTLHHALL